MEENELTSIACSEKKRKLQEEQPETPSPKQICLGHHLNHDKFAKEGESFPESTSSNSFLGSSSYSFISHDDEDRNNPGFQETRTSDEASTSFNGFSSHNRLSINSKACEQEPSSINEDQDSPGYENKRQAEIGFYTDKELENLLYSNGIAPSSSYVLSSGRRSVGQEGAEAEEGKKKLTIDKEFEQHFSMLLL